MNVVTGVRGPPKWKASKGTRRGRNVLVGTARFAEVTRRVEGSELVARSSPEALRGIVEEGQVRRGQKKEKNKKKQQQRLRRPPGTWTRRRRCEVAVETKKGLQEHCGWGREPRRHRNWSLARERRVLVPTMSVWVGVFQQLCMPSVTALVVVMAGAPILRLRLGGRRGEVLRHARKLRRARRVVGPRRWRRRRVRPQMVAGKEDRNRIAEVQG